jgi:UDP-N-acetyl-D-glucosamine dehydrogenase
MEARFIELAGAINGQMPHFVAEKIQNALNDRSKPLRGARVLVMGVAYKRNIDDVRESPALDVMHVLRSRGAEVSYSDPYVPRMELGGEVMESVELLDGVGEADCVVIITDHSEFPYREVVERAAMVVDTRNALKGVVSDKIVRL